MIDSEDEDSPAEDGAESPLISTVGSAARVSHRSKVWYMSFSSSVYLCHQDVGAIFSDGRFQRMNIKTQPISPKANQALEIINSLIIHTLPPLAHYNIPRNSTCFWYTHQHCQ
jgi:hypothetical protein